MIRVSSWWNDVPALLLRLSLGWVFAASGWGKLHNLHAVAGYFTDLGVPVPAVSAAVTGVLELVTGVLLCAGLAVRPSAAALIPTMAVAAVLAHRDELTGLGSFLSLTEVTYLASLAMLVRHGGGRLGIDRQPNSV